MNVLDGQTHLNKPV